MDLPRWSNKPVVVGSSLGSGETVSVSRIVALAPQLSFTLNIRLRSLCIMNESECSTKALLTLLSIDFRIFLRTFLAPNCFIWSNRCQDFFCSIAIIACLIGLISCKHVLFCNFCMNHRIKQMSDDDLMAFKPFQLQPRKSNQYIHC